MDNCCYCASDVIGQTKYVCLHCIENYTFCEMCEANSSIFTSHENGKHMFAKVKPNFDMSNFEKYKIKPSEAAENTMYDPFAMQTYNFKKYEFDDDVERIDDPLEL